MFLAIAYMFTDPCLLYTSSGTFEVKTAWDGEVLGTVQIVNSNVWEKYEIQAQIPDGKQAIYFTYRGYGNLDLLSFTLE